MIERVIRYGVKHGEGIVGEYAGVKLERIPFDVAYWKEWKKFILKVKF